MSSFSTLLDMVQQACGEINLTQPSIVAAATDDQGKQLFALANAAGRDLAKAHQWSALIDLGSPFQMTTVNGQTDYPLPSDFDRLVSSTEWDKTNHWRMMGPDTPQVARWRLDSNLAQASVRRSFRLIGRTTVRIFPTPNTTTAGNLLELEYVSKNWAASAGGTSQDRFLADTDTTVFDPQLVTMAIKYKFMAAKGFDASALYAEYSNRLKQCIAADIGGPTLSANQKLTEQFLNFQNIPEVGYGK